MDKPKTTRDEIDIDLDGSIDGAIATLKKLKKQYPDGTISLENEYEYGESYAKLKLRFTRDKEPIELEYDKWHGKLVELGKLRSASQAFATEGQDYPRSDELAALEDELGAWGGNRYGSLMIFDGELVMNDMMRGGYRRDGSWVFRTMFGDRYDDIFAQWDGNPKGQDPQGLGAKHDSPVGEADAP